MKKIFFLITTFGILLTSCLKEDINNAIGVVNPVTTLDQVRAFYKGADVDLTAEKLSGSTKIDGVVISDATNKNVTTGNLILQDYGRGIVRGITLVLGAEAANYAQGDSILVEIVGTKLVNNNGSLQITGVTGAKIKKIASNVATSVRQTSLADIVTNFANYEGSLVRVNSDVKPTPVTGETYSGDKGLNDGTSAAVKLHTETTATFATNRVPASAAFTGIVTYGGDTTKKQIWMRNTSDVANASGPLYDKFPEDFESPDATQKASYAAAVVTLKTGAWMFDQAILGNTGGRDRFNPAGLQCVRMQQNLSTPAYLQMNFDLPNGATKVTFTYGAYYTDAMSTFRLEYSTDSGVTWQKLGNDVSDPPAGSKGATYIMNISGKVRFRINKLGLGTTGGAILNGRLSIEDFAVYQN